MANDVQGITGTPAIVGARLGNIPTAKSTLLPAHLAWLDTQAIPRVKTRIAPWIDIIGYASRKGDVAFNQRVSFQRCEAVKNHIRLRLGQAEFNVENAKGETESLGDEKNDDGYWRAVEVYVFGFQPPEPIAKPTPSSPGSRQFKIRIRMGVSASPPFLSGPQGDAYYFEVVDVTRRLHAIFGYAGAGLALPTFLPSFLSLSGTGPYTNFTTSRSESLSSFDGPAQFFGDPGITIGPASAGGLVRLALESRTLVSHVTLLNPSIIPISGGAGVSVTAASATRGVFRMLTKAVPIVGAP